MRMIKLFMKILCLTLLATSVFANINTNKGNQKIQLPQHTAGHLNVPIKVNYQGNDLTITNISKKEFTLNNAFLSIISNSSIKSIQGQGTWQVLKQWGQANQPNGEGILYLYKTGKNTHTLAPGQNIHLTVNTNSNIHAVQLYADPLVPVQAKFTVTDGPSTTINICNDSTSSIPLTNMQLDFSYQGNITSIWGTPWMNWQIQQPVSGQYQLTGGANSSYAPDPTCSNPMTVQFTPTAGAPDPSDFTLMAAGGTPIGDGNLAITLPTSPYSNAASPTITVVGMGEQYQKTLAWGQAWSLQDLVPGKYLVYTSRLNDGTHFAYAKPQSTTVVDQQTNPINLVYALWPTGSVQVNLANAPQSSEPVRFSNVKTGTYNVTAKDNQTITLPAGSYAVTSTVMGYSATATPNPVSIAQGQNASLSLTYTKQADNFYVGYFQSWSSPYASNGADTDLAHLPSYVNYVDIAFMQPDATYVAGSYDLSGTGIQTSYSGQVLKQAIDALHEAQPNTKILISVGGATYTNWDDINIQAIADLVKDFDLDGVDIDFEPADPGCTTNNGTISCSIDSQYQSIVDGIRQALPKPYIESIAAFSVGAYGEGQWANAQPVSAHTGQVLPLLRSSAASDLDVINVMSYDASDAYNPEQALAAYQNYFPGGIIAMGVEVPPESWGGHVYNLQQVAKLTAASMKDAGSNNNPAGMMIWSLDLAPSNPSPSNPNAQMMSSLICGEMGLGNCQDPLFP